MVKELKIQFQKEKDISSGLREGTTAAQQSGDGPKNISVWRKDYSQYDVISYRSQDPESNKNRVFDRCNMFCVWFCLSLGPQEDF